MNKPTRNRRRAPINKDVASDTFSDLWDAAPDADTEEGKFLSATELSRASGTWRKINQYLNFPAGHPDRIEAESILRNIGVIYKNGRYNSRSFLFGDVDDE